MNKYTELKELVEYVAKILLDLPYPYRGPDGNNDYHHVVRLVMEDMMQAMEVIDEK